MEWFMWTTRIICFQSAPGMPFCLKYRTHESHIMVVNLNGKLRFTPIFRFHQSFLRTIFHFFWQFTHPANKCSLFLSYVPITCKHIGLGCCPLRDSGIQQWLIDGGTNSRGMTFLSKYNYPEVRGRVIFSTADSRKKTSKACLWAVLYSFCVWYGLHEGW